MGQISKTLEAAQQRGKAKGLAYSGEMTPQEAYEVWKSAPGAKLVDVRSKAECDWVGRVPGAIEIEWASYPGMQPNPNFMSALQQQVDKESVVLFLCRSGARSHNAANVAVQAGYTAAYNILEGFEGDKSAGNQRNQTNGWRKAGLPWEQS